MMLKLDTRVIRVDDDVYSKIIEKKSEIERKEKKSVSFGEALRELLNIGESDGG